jgi:hypothetical protein
MNPPEPNDPLDALLRQPGEYLEDNGFTARVVAALSRRRRGWLRAAVLLGAVLLGFGLAVWWLPWGELSALDVSAWRSLDAHALMPWVLVITVMSSLVWGALAALEWRE